MSSSPMDSGLESEKQPPPANRHSEFPIPAASAWNLESHAATLRGMNLRRTEKQQKEVVANEGPFKIPGCSL